MRCFRFYDEKKQENDSDCVSASLCCRSTHCCKVHQLYGAQRTRNPRYELKLARPLCCRLTLTLPRAKAMAGIRIRNGALRLNVRIGRWSRHRICCSIRNPESVRVARFDLSRLPKWSAGQPSTPRATPASRPLLDAATGRKRRRAITVRAARPSTRYKGLVLLRSTLATGIRRVPRGARGG
jgi:hypothetical protein